MDRHVSRLLAESATLQRLSCDLMKDSKRKSEEFARLSARAKRLCELMQAARQLRFAAAIDEQHLSLVERVLVDDRTDSELR